jgi:MFS family permease
MYSEEDINSAVSAGALSAEAAASFRAHMTAVRQLPRGSEEDFRLINSFNDIFVSIGIVILLLAVGAIGQALAGLVAPVPDLFNIGSAAAPPTDAEMDAWAAAQNLNDAFEAFFAGLLVAAAAWPLAEFFTRRRRMALPSILLLLTFVGGVFATILGATMAIVAGSSLNVSPLYIALAALVAAGGAFLHWRRFMVPITMAAGAGGIAVTVIALIVSAIGIENSPPNVVLVLVGLAGLAMFAFAMRWDMSDRERITRRSDVAFWLHLLAAPMIAHPIFALLGVTEGTDLNVGAAIGVLAVYIGFGLIALAIDRRALLVSALAYVLFALAFLFDRFGAVELTFALTALVIGSALLSLSAFWQPIRRSVVTLLPEGLQAKLPATEAAPLPAATAATA